MSETSTGRSGRGWTSSGPVILRIVVHQSRPVRRAHPHVGQSPTPAPDTAGRPAAINSGRRSSPADTPLRLPIEGTASQHPPRRRRGGVPPPQRLGAGHCGHAPDRLIGVACLPLPDVDDAVAELERLRAWTCLYWRKKIAEVDIREMQESDDRQSAVAAVTPPPRSICRRRTLSESSRTCLRLPFGKRHQGGSAATPVGRRLG